MVTTKRTASGRHLAGMGSIPRSRGTAFRVWAPHADTVDVIGDFNGWADGADALASEGNGYWYGYVRRARPGHEYRYRLHAGDRVIDRVDPYAYEVTNSVGNGVIYDQSVFDWEGDEFTCPDHNTLVIYETHVGTFTDEDEGVGDLYDLTGKLDHLTRLGVNAIQLMPVAEFAGDLSWGYNPSHIFAVESAYGGPDGLKTFVRTAHRAGIAVILDVVYNHFGPSDLNLWQFDGWSENGKGGIYFYNDDRSRTPWGDTRPDYGRGEVRMFIRDNALHWMEHFHLDGLRFDMTPYVRSVSGSGFDLPEGWSLMRWLNEEIHSRFPAAITIAEDLHGYAQVTGFDADGAKFNAQWDAHFVHPVRAALETPDDGQRSMVDVRDAIAYSYGNTYARVIYTESHDEVANGRARVPEQIDPGNATGWPAQKRSTLGAGLVLTAPGIPMLFQGQEFLEGGWFRDSVPIDWDHSVDFQGIANLYRDLIRLRLDLDETSRGLQGHGLSIYHVNDDANVLAFQRWADHGPGDDVVVVVNCSVTAQEDYWIGMPDAGTWRLRLNSDASQYSSLFGNHPSGDITAEDGDRDGMQAHARLTIAPYTILVYSQDAG